MSHNDNRHDLRGLGFLKRNLPVHLHPYTPIVARIVNTRLEWLEEEDRESALLHGAALLHQAWEDRRWPYTDAQFGQFAALRMQRLIGHFQPEISERQRANERRWDRKNGRSRTRDEQWREIRLTRGRRWRHTGAVPNQLPRRARSLDGLLQLPTEEEQLQVEQGYGSESVMVTYGASNGDSQGSLIQVRYTLRFVSAMRTVDKLRLLLPDRERELLRLVDEGPSLAAVCQYWGISRPRGTQIHKSALQRLGSYLRRLQAGETFSTLLAESVATNGPINRRSQALSKKVEKKCDAGRHIP